MKNLIIIFCLLTFVSTVEAKTKVTITYTTKTQSTASVAQKPTLKAHKEKLPSESIKRESLKNSRIANKEGVVPPSPIGTEAKILARFSEFGDDVARTAVAISKAESGMRCDAVGDGHIAYMQDGVEYGKSYGVFQIRHLPGRPSPTYLADCDQNIEYAYGMYKAQGHFKAWSVFTNQRYLKFL